MALVDHDNWAARLGSRLGRPIRVALVLASCTVVLLVSRSFLATFIGRSLMCQEEIAPSDLVLIDNSDGNYLAFERAAGLLKAGVAPRVATTIQADVEATGPTANRVADGIADVMARVAWLEGVEKIPIVEQEPITLNAAYQVREYALRRQVRSILIAVSAFRSQRTMLIYRAVMEPSGVTVRCVPIVGKSTSENWSQTWHGIQGVTEQFLKLQYYRFYVLPFRTS